MTLTGFHVRRSETNDERGPSHYLDIPSDGPTAAESGLAHLDDEGVAELVECARLQATNKPIRDPEAVRELIRESLLVLGTLDLGEVVQERDVQFD